MKYFRLSYNLAGRRCRNCDQGSQLRTPLEPAIFVIVKDLSHLRSRKNPVTFAFANVTSHLRKGGLRNSHPGFAFAKRACPGLVRICNPGVAFTKPENLVIAKPDLAIARSEAWAKYQIPSTFFPSPNALRGLSKTHPSPRDSKPDMHPNLKTSYGLDRAIKSSK